jgi:glutamate racemase
MRAKFSMPIIGTVPVIKTLASISKTKKAAVFSTPATASSPYLTELINKFAPDLEIFKIGGSSLEELIEEGDLNSPQIDAVLNELLPPLVTKGVDAIALSCTHYPFLTEKIKKIVGDNVVVVDSGGAVARRVNQVLTNNEILADQKTVDEYYTTGDANKFHRVAKILMKIQIPTAQHIDL